MIIIHLSGALGEGIPCYRQLTSKELTDYVYNDCLNIIHDISDAADNKFKCRHTNNNGDEYYYVTNVESKQNFPVYVKQGQNQQMLKYLHNKYIVYRLSDVCSGKVYHGKTNNLMRRIVEHCENHNASPSDESMCNDFVREGAVCEILFICDTEEEAREIEKTYNDRMITCNGTKIYTYNIKR